MASLGNTKSITSGKSDECTTTLLVPERPLPVTLLSGFLGSGKTTVLQHILRSKHGLRIAVVVNDIGAINIDAALINKGHQATMTDENIIALQNGCICCTLRGDLLQELVRIAQLQRFDYIVIESSGISEPELVAGTFDARLAENEAGGLGMFARLDTTVTVIDAFTVLHDFDTADFLSFRRHDVTPEDERTVSDLMVDQIEFADVVILNKTDMVDDAAKQVARNVIRRLNHRAEILEASYGRVDVREVVNTGLFKLYDTPSEYGWPEELPDMAIHEEEDLSMLAPKPQTKRYNEQSFIYSRNRPFHPKRLFTLLHKTFILQLEKPLYGYDEEGDDEGDREDGQEVGDEIDWDRDDSHSSGSTAGTMGRDVSQRSSSSTCRAIPSPTPKRMSRSREERAKLPVNPVPHDVILATKRAHPILSRLFRSKGEYHLATRPHRAGDWSQAGAILTLTSGPAWVRAQDAAKNMTGHGEWGRHCQKLVFIGEGLDSVALEGMLDDCLLTDIEFRWWHEVMRNGSMDDVQKREMLRNLFEDAFPDWEDDFEDMEFGGHGL
ncbi:metal chaperone YciC [Tolypocladium capitatum]|uniref:Metal chaperone YciC n=1 Tax=Tolypocladium capitatum TaxID=45235 RepID=A0A2K3QJX3_9HYPO|nr:metal chaperone YciC [Tolypocladium capitatum]